MKGIIFDIKRYALHDGPGIRITVFFKGCPLQCWWCHNPESREAQPREMQARWCPDDGGASICHMETVGREVTVEDVMREIGKETVFIDESGGGVTFSGGEPLMQPQFLKALLEACRDLHLHTILDTTGHAPAPVFQDIIDRVDLFYYDIKLTREDLHKRYTGVGMQFILANLKSLVEGGKKVVIRFPVVPGITDTEENIDGLLKLMVELGLPEVHLLPYHGIADAKYQWLSLENRMEGVQPPEKEALRAISRRFEEQGITVKKGG